ncbi:helix-turn-helix domain-containing protein [Streptosporangium sp. NPDC002721]|uniref:AlbA family DNA-binding domain-containing protein n=1 Tax=Streptosporangium sp. NPDC002721 TaxID=3366188 RepID=UPI0036CF0055
MRYQRKISRLKVGNVGSVPREGKTNFLAYFPVIAEASASSLRSELLRLHRALIEPEGCDRSTSPVKRGWDAAKKILYPALETIVFTDWPEDSWDPDCEFVPRDPVRIRLMRNGSIQIHVLLGQVICPDGLTNRDFLVTLKSWAERRGMRLTALGRDELLDDAWVAELDAPSLRGLTIKQLWQHGKDFFSATRRLELRHLDAELTIAALITGNLAKLHQYESLWIDVKSRDYMSGSRGEIEFGQDVARFANSEEGGLLVLGVGEKKDGKGAKIGKIHPIAKVIPEDQRRKILDKVVYPRIDGLRVANFPYQDKHGDGYIVVVDVPPQPEHLKPFLVKGAIVEGKVEGAFIGIVRRRGEDSIPTDIAEIHAMMTKGRLL